MAEPEATTGGMCGHEWTPVGPICVLPADHPLEHSNANNSVTWSYVACWADVPGARSIDLHCMLPTGHDDGVHDAKPEAPTGRTTRDSAVHIAEQFHRRYENLAVAMGYQTRVESAVPWADVPAKNRALMVSTVASLLLDGVISEARP